GKPGPAGPGRHAFCPARAVSLRGWPAGAGGAAATGNGWPPARTGAAICRVTGYYPQLPPDSAPRHKSDARPLRLGGPLRSVKQPYKRGCLTLKLPDMITPILVAGATGDLGGRLVAALHQRGAAVRALVRPETDPANVARLTQLGVEVRPVDFADHAALTSACAGVSCVVSVLAGLREVIVDTQRQLLAAAVAAGVARFIPSDFC
nr:hypothetical protein [Tanacetum cinerariifolium]